MSKYVNKILFVLMLISFQANAVLYKNPVTDLAAGNKAGGVSFVSMSRDLDIIGFEVEGDQTLLAGSVTFGIDGMSAFEIRLGLDDAEITGEPAADGILFGGLYRRTFSDAGNGMKVGGFASVQVSSVDNNSSDTDITVVDIGAGVSKDLGQDMNAYAGGVLSILDGTITINNFASADFEEADTLGFFVGIDKKLQGNMKVGFEFNLLHQTGFAAFLEVPF